MAPLSRPGLANGEAELTRDIALSSGFVRGAARDARGVLTFKGIPYAAPPVDALRWRPPQRVEPWDGVRDCTAYGASCPGARIPGFVQDAVGESEDCLTLNIWTAAAEASERRPVMVWIHGGGFQFGSSAMRGTDGSAFAEAGVVLVSINYRLGVFGFLTLSELDAEGSASGNYGLQDMIAALAWVRDTIAAFGGDANRVTIFGESAGAHAVGLLMASPPARGLFHRAIAQSGAWWDSEHGSIATAAEARARGRALQDAQGAASIADLRAIPVHLLAKATAWNFLLDPGTTAFAPSIDGAVLPEAPGAVFARGAQADVPLIAGWNAQEEAFFTTRGLPTAPKRFRSAAAEQFGGEAVAAHLELFPNDGSGTRAAADGLAGDLVISAQVWAMLGSHARTATAGAWGYQFGYTSAFAPRAIHTAEIPFVFGDLGRAKRPPDTADTAMSAALLGCWSRFAATGDPDGAAAPHWPRYAGAGGSVLHFGSVIAAGPATGVERLRFIESFREAGRLPDAWRAVRGRLPVRAAGLARHAILLAAGLRAALMRRARAAPSASRRPPRRSRPPSR